MRRRRSRNNGQDTLKSAAVSDFWQADHGGRRRCNGCYSRGLEDGRHQHPSMDAPIAARLRLPGDGRMRAFLLALVLADIFPCCSTTTGGHGQPVSSQSLAELKPSGPPGVGSAAAEGSQRRIIGGVDAQGRYPWAVQIGKVGGQALTVCIPPTPFQPSLCPLYAISSLYDLATCSLVSTSASHTRSTSLPTSEMR